MVNLICFPPLSLQPLSLSLPSVWLQLDGWERAHSRIYYSLADLVRRLKKNRILKEKNGWRKLISQVGKGQ